MLAFFLMTSSVVVFAGSNDNTANSLLYKNTPRYDITFQNTTGNNNLTYQKIDKEVAKVAKNVNKIISSIPRTTKTGECSDTGCNLDSVQCDAVFEKPLCPHNGKLNPVRDMCQIDPTIVCPSGYTWDKSIDKCISHNVCLDGGTLNEEKDRCEKVVDNQCPSGYSYDSSKDVCWKKVVCAHGSFNSSRDRCELSFTKSCPSGYGYNSSRNRCERNPVCPSGMTYNTTYNICLKNFTKGCASGYSFNSSRNRCERNPVCPGGASYNSYLNKCAHSKITKSVQQTFPGRTWSSTMGIDATIWINFYWSSSKRKLFWIQSSSDWPTRRNVFLGYSWHAGYLYSSSGIYHTWTGFNSREYGAPINAAYWQACWSARNYLNEVSIPAGVSNVQVQVTATNTGGSNQYWNHTFYSSNQNRTLSYPVGGTSGAGMQYPYVTVKVIGSTTTSVCPTGYQTSSGTCIQNPSCPNGGQLDGNADKCYKAFTKNCPSGTSYSSSLNMCTKSSSCPNGSLDTYRDKCFLSYSPTCSYGNYDTANKICYSNPICNLGNYNSFANECRATITRYCGNNYTWSSAIRKCIDNPTCQKDSSFTYNSSINYSTILNICLSKTKHNCPTSYTYSPLPTEKCENVPVCANGVYNPDNNGCFLDKYTCPIDPNLPCLGTQKFNHWCSPWSCNQNNKCGYGYCLNNNPSSTPPWMLRSLLNNMQYIRNGQCTNQKCDLVKNRDISYCGQESVCPQGFGVYEKNGQCYANQCPDGSQIGGDGTCYIKVCPTGTTDQGDGTCK